MSFNCCVCHKEFNEDYGPEQADHCASDMDDKEITCHYGSDYDTDWFVYIDYFFPVQRGPICDHCITTLYIDGFILRNEGWGYDQEC
jgi:hypothetical protein